LKEGTKMAKGQKHGNREVKKPKATKKASAATPPTTTVALARRPAPKGAAG
jgi:hypothetical protein